MPYSFKSKEVIFMPCYNTDRDGEEDNGEKLAFEASHSSTTKITFIDKDLFLGSKPYNQILYIEICSRTKG